MREKGQNLPAPPWPSNPRFYPRVKRHEESAAHQLLDGDVLVAEPSIELLNFALIPLRVDKGPLLAGQPQLAQQHPDACAAHAPSRDVVERQTSLVESELALPECPQAEHLLVVRAQPPRSPRARALVQQQRRVPLLGVSVDAAATGDARLDGRGQPLPRTHHPHSRCTPTRTCPATGGTRMAVRGTGAE